MLTRCYDSRHEAYDRYGGRGITVCDAWQGPSGLARFIADMGPRPDRKHTLDRIDNDSGYSKENCRWVTAQSQARNTSKFRLTPDLVSKAAKMIEDRTYSDVASELGVSPVTVWRAIKRHASNSIKENA